MNSKIASILQAYIASLPFVSKSAGLVKELKFKSGTKAMNIPVDLDTTITDCQGNFEKAYVPDAKHSGIVYFEDRASRAKNQDARYVNMESKLRLVGWFNMDKIGDVSFDMIVLNIINAIPETPGNKDHITKIHIEFEGEEIRTPNIFSKYNYDDKVNYLNKPYEFCALNYKVNYSVPYAAIQAITLNQKTC